MEYIAIRENQRRDLLSDLITRQHPGKISAINQRAIRANSFATRSLGAGAIIPANINHPEPSR